MKAMFKPIIFNSALILAVLVIIVFILNKSISVEMTLIKEFNDTKDMPISECPVYWTYVDDNKHGTLHFEQNVEEYLNDYDYSKGALVISWGRPLHSLLYKRMSKLKSSKAVIGQVIFEVTETPSTIYIYQVQNIDNMHLISEYDNTLIYPEIKIRE